MSEPPAQHQLKGDEWRPLADQIAVNVKDFIDGVEALASSGGDETVPLLLLEVSQILLAGAQLGASRDVHGPRLVLEGTGTRTPRACRSGSRTT